MSNFVKYQRVKRYGRLEVAGIEDGNCLVFPKLDGTNASVWVEDGEVHCGSRRRHLSLVNDNAGFCSWVVQGTSTQAQNLRHLVTAFPEIRFFGEWLVPHAFKGYRDDAWRRFYIFDAYDRNTGEIIPYDVYRDWCGVYNVDYIPCIAVVHFGCKDQFWDLTETNDYLCKPGAGPGEGIVIKRYDFINKFGQTIWAKMIRSEFKEKNYKEFGCPVVKGAEKVEQKIAATAVTATLVHKERAKIESLAQDKPIQPRLLETVWLCVICEELYDLLRKFKYATIDFKLLRRLCFAETKRHASDLF